jgi:signal transduction histidine kinase
MRSRWGTATLALLLVWAVASLVVAWGLATGDAAMRDEAVAGLTLPVPAAVLAGLILVRCPGSPGGTALGALAACSATAEAITVWGLSAASPHPWPLAALGAYLATGIWVLHFGGFVSICLVFPDGMLRGRFWRGVAVAYALLVVAVVATLPLMGTSPDDMAVVPFASEALALLVVFVCAAACPVVRYSRGDDVTRDQLRWLALGAGSVVVLWMVGEVAQTLGASISWAYTPFMLALLVVLPATVAIAVVRDDLFDIERLLTDSVTWVLTTVAAAAFFALVVALVLRAAEGIGATTSYALAAFVTAVAVGPLHGQLRDLVGRVLDRDRTVRLETVRRFVRQVRDGERQPPDLESLLRELLQDEGARVLLDVPGRRTVTLDGEPAADRPGVELLSGGTRIGTVVLSRRSRRRERLARLLVTEAALPLELARSQVQLRAALIAVEDSRSRILTAEAEARRQLERDLHDGAQQRIVAVGMRLRSAQRRAQEPDVVRGELDAAVVELEQTVQELRRLALGLRPAGLDDGLRAAVQQLVHRSPVPTTVEVDDVDLPEPVLTTAYYIVAEGVTNALKHAHASHVGVQARTRSDGRLVVQVHDDGRGGAAGRADLTTLRDRVDALGGTLELLDRQPTGTVLRAVL